jgi:hypothetical protein
MRTQHPAQVLLGRRRGDAGLLLDARERHRNGGAPIAAGTHHLLAQDVGRAARVGHVDAEFSRRRHEWIAPLAEDCLLQHPLHQTRLASSAMVARRTSGVS